MTIEPPILCWDYGYARRAHYDDSGRMLGFRWAAPADVGVLTLIATAAGVSLTGQLTLPGRGDRLNCFWNVLRLALETSDQLKFGADPATLVW